MAEWLRQPPGQCEVCDLLNRLCWLLEYLVAEEPDSGNEWFDGIAPAWVRSPAPETVEVTGAVYVVDGDEWRLHPILATVSVAAGGTLGPTVVKFRKHDHDGYPLKHNVHKIRFDDPDGEWVYVFDSEV